MCRAPGRRRQEGHEVEAHRWWLRTVQEPLVILAVFASPETVEYAVGTEAKKDQHLLFQSLPCEDIRCLHGPPSQAQGEL